MPSHAADEFTAPVRAALSPEDYLAKIRASSPAALQQLRDLVDRGKFKEACEELLIGRADEMIQSTFYLPWAILEGGDEKRAVRALALSDRFQASVERFKRASRQAASFVGEEDAVLLALDEMKEALISLVDQV